MDKLNRLEEMIFQERSKSVEALKEFLDINVEDLGEEDLVKYISNQAIYEVFNIVLDAIQQLKEEEN